MYDRMHIVSAAVAAALSSGLIVAPGHAAADGLTPIELLGRDIFFDETLSIRRNQACASCHVPEVGWVGDDTVINAEGAVYEGSRQNRFGNRKPPSSAYASLAPVFYADFGNRLLGDGDPVLAADPLFVGGNFWDGRATGWKLRNPAADQAQGPFLNPVEQALPDAACVVNRVCEGAYGDLFRQVWGPQVCSITWPNNTFGQCNNPQGAVNLSVADRNRVDAAYDRVALSIAAFEGSKASNAFTSKIDALRAGLYEFTTQEALGRDVFRGKGQCAACHVGTPGPGAPPPLFTNFTFDNLGVPKNPLNPFTIANPDWADPGLSAFLENVAGFARYAEANVGKHKVPTLRNVGLGSCEAIEYDAAAGDPATCITKAYMHNGYFKTLKQVVQFYNTRDVKPSCESLGIDDATVDMAMANDCWPAPEVAANLNTTLMGDLGLTDEEEDALVAFMIAMSDGYDPDAEN